MARYCVAGADHPVLIVIFIYRQCFSHNPEWEHAISSSQLGFLVAQSPHLNPISLFGHNCVWMYFEGHGNPGCLRRHLILNVTTHKQRGNIVK
mmetsp:Transcript_2363/g.4080  ORF Transcript_2363/g.4080 Transcript_2363/m.4080 type:complete len:93 (-) Transcript_2363:1434-1712(-)